METTRRSYLPQRERRKTQAVEEAIEADFRLSKTRSRLESKELLGT